MGAPGRSSEPRASEPQGEARVRARVPLHVAAGMLALWVLLSGKIDAFHIGVGVATVALVAWNHRRLRPIPGVDRPPVRVGRLLLYGGWLFWEIMVSSIYVARVVLQPKAHLDPQLIAFRSSQPSVLTSVIFANSITLTPGTITVDLEEDLYTVHALTKVTAKELLGGKMAARVARLASDERLAPPEAITPEEASPRP